MADKTGEQVPEKIAFDSHFTGNSDNPAYELAGKTDPNYSMVSAATMNGENTGAANDSKNSDGEDNTKKSICLVAIILVSIIMLMLIVGCFIFLFLEVANLKSELSSFEQTLPSERASVTTIHLQHINESLLNLEEKLETVTCSKVQLLNASIDRSFSNIEDRFEDIVNLQNTNMRQLNICVQAQETLQDIANQFNVQIYGNFSTIENRLTEIENLQNSRIDALLAGLCPSFPATSCAALPPSSPSGYYWVRASNGSAVRVYCDMTRSCGGVTGGWVRVAELDMTNSSHQCPSSLRQRNDSDNRTCVRDSNSRGCSSVTFSSATLEYSKVRGKIRAYQFGTPDAFASGRPSNPSIDTYYVDGVGLTHGSPRQHIWTLAAAHNEETGRQRNCPCTNTNTASQATQPPPFVRNDYFCDTASRASITSFILYGDDPLWDGAGCGPLNTCCTLNNPPWFCKQLPQPTTDDIEMRVCRDEDASNEDIAIEMVEIYIQ